MTALNLPAWLVLLIVGLAAARTHRLVTYDWLSQWWVTLLGKWAHEKPASWRMHAFTGWLCPFCLGFWLTLGWLASALAWSDTIVWQLLACSLGLNYVAGHFNARFEV